MDLPPIREIADRHEAETPAPGERMAWHPRHEQAHADRGVLLSLLRRVAQGHLLPRREDEGRCVFCLTHINEYDDPHAADCPAPLLEALR